MTDTPKESAGRRVHRGDARLAGRARGVATRAASGWSGREFKWRKPCYTHGGSNVVIFQPLSSCARCCSSRARCFRTRRRARGAGREHPLRAAPRVPLRRRRHRRERDFGHARSERHPRRAGRPVSPEARSRERRALPRGARQLLDADPALRDAWEHHPGRRRGWLLHFSGAKQSGTRIARIERATPRIMEGFGMHDPNTQHKPIGGTGWLSLRRTRF